MHQLRSSIWLAAVFAFAPVLSGSAVAADYVVLDSDAAGIEPGLVATGEAVISIPSGATVVLIDPAGETRVVTGPFSGPVSQAASAGGDSGVLDRLTAGREQERTTLGARRAPKFDGGALKE